MKNFKLWAAYVALIVLMTIPSHAGTILRAGIVTDEQIRDSGILNVGHWYDDGVLADSVVIAPIGAIAVGPVNLSEKSREPQHWPGGSRDPKTWTKALALSDRIGPHALDRLLSPALREKLRGTIGESAYCTLTGYEANCNDRHLVILSVPDLTPFYSFYSSEDSYDWGFLVPGDTAICYETPAQIHRLRQVDPQGYTNVIDIRWMLAVGQDICGNPAFGLVPVKWYVNKVPPQYIRTRTEVPVASVPVPVSCASPNVNVTVINQGSAAMAPMQTYFASGATAPYSNNTYIVGGGRTNISVSASAAAAAGVVINNNGCTTTCPPGTPPSLPPPPVLPPPPTGPNDPTTPSGPVDPAGKVK